MTDLRAFLTESLRIEGIYRPPTDAEMQTAKDFLDLESIFVPDVVDLVKVFEPDAMLRLRAGLNVRVGNHIAPPGGPELHRSLMALLAKISARTIDPWHAHCEYETLHPFTDGNGRSGRMIWLWQMRGDAPLGFLHSFYYDTLANYEGRQ